MADLHVHTLTVRNHRITCDSPVLVQHGMGHDAIALDLDAEWDGLSVRLVLGPCGSAYDVLYEGEPVVVPAATLAEAGWLPVSVVGHGSDGAVRVTTKRCDHLLRVVESGCVDGSVPPEDAPDLLGQLVEAAERADASAEAADKAAAEATGAANAATEAAGRVDAAVESAEAATKAATDAAASATSAAKQASDAAETAEKLAKDIPAYATAAEKAATEAARAASQADGSATAAGKSASAAAGSAERAAGSATAAQGSAAEASGSARQAATSAGEAAGSATTASESAEAAQGHAQDAQQSAAEAESWADAAQVSAGNVLTGTASGPVAHADDAYSAKPREVRIEGKTWVNRCSEFNRLESGITFSTDETGLITVSGTATENVFAAVPAVGIVPSKQYFLAVSSYPSGINQVYFQIVDDGTYKPVCKINSSSATSVTGSTPSSFDSASLVINVNSGSTVNASFRIMLVEGTEAPNCFTPTGVHGVEPEKLMVAGKNLLSDSDLSIMLAYNSTVSDGVITTTKSDGQAWSQKPDGPILPPGQYTFGIEVIDGLEDGQTAWLEVSQTGKKVTTTTTVTLDGLPLKLKVFKYGNGEDIASNYRVPLKTRVWCELVSTATAYDPPQVTEIPIPLEEPLMSVGDRADELVIDAHGTATVNREVAKIDADSPGWKTFTDTGTTKFTTIYLLGNQDTSKWPDLPSNIAVSRTLVANDTLDVPRFACNSESVFFRVPSTLPPTNVTEMVEYMRELGAYCYAPAEQTTDQLGTVQTPQLPAPTFNAYATGGYVPGETSVGYERDVNIAYAELEAKIAALTVAQATS